MKKIQFKKGAILLKSRLLTVLIWMFVLGLIAVGCSSTETDVEKTTDTPEDDTEQEEVAEEEEESEGEGEDSMADELRFAINAQPPTLDPLISTADATRDVILQVFEPLVTHNSSLQPEPMLAESFEESDDGKTITFNLREGVKFHNGDEMTAEDVVVSMERWLEHSSRAKAAFSNATFEAEDDYTVLLKMEGPNRIALSVLSSPTQMPAIMPKEIVESAGEEGVDELIGTGPYKFEEWKQDQYIKLTRFDDYQPSSDPSDGPAGKREAFIKDLYFMVVTDSSTRVAGIQTGEYDIAMQIPFDNYDQLEDDPNIKTYTAPDGFDLLVFNNKEGILADVTMRQAIAATLDLEAILHSALSNEVFYNLNPGLMLEEQTDWYSDAGKEVYNQQDLDKTEQLLEEAGYDGETITLLTSREYMNQYNASVVIKEQLEQAGMNVELEVYDWATVQEIRSDPSAYNAFITGFSISTDPTQFIFLDSKNEWDGWTESDEIDRILDEIRSSTTQEEAMELNAELQEEFWSYLPGIKFGDKNFLYAISEDVEGFQDINGVMLWNVKKSN